MSEDDELAKRRATLVEEKKRELDVVYDAHDSVVCTTVQQTVWWLIFNLVQLRELFHIQKFVTLIGFDPQACSPYCSGALKY